MKKKISLIPIAAAGILLFAACEKKSMSDLNAPTTVKQEPAAETAAKDKPEPHPSIDGTWDDHFRDCFQQVRTNCTILKEIVVVPKTFTLRIRNTITRAEVAELFNDPGVAGIANSLPPEHRMHLQAGHYYVAIASETESTACVFMGFSPELNSDNMSFVFKYNK